VSERTFRRWRDRYDEEGEAGFLDRRLGKASGKRVPVDRAEEVEALYRRRDAGFTAQHFHEHLVKDCRFRSGYTWTKLFLQAKGLLPKAPRKGAHRRRRERRPLPGMMLHQDGSRHQWLEGQPALDLIVTLDDATGAIYSAFLIEEEGTASTFRALKEVFGQHGLPISLYTDRGAHYFRTTKAAEIDRDHLTQVGRALEQLGVEPIGAYSPQARGAWDTGVPDAAGPSGEGAEARWGRLDRGGQRLPWRRLPARPQSALRGSRRLPPVRPSRRSRASISTRSCACRKSAR
jgi:hypothetical protein